MTQITCRDFTAENYYSNQLQHYFPNRCRHPALFIKKEEIRNELVKRASLYAVNQISLLVCAVTQPTEFFITFSATVLCAFVGNTVWQRYHPPVNNLKTGWKDYFEGTVILEEKTARMLLAGMIAHVIFNGISSIIWPDDMVWYNAILVGLSIGIITSKTLMKPENLRFIQQRLTRDNMAEPLLNPAETV